MSAINTRPVQQSPGFYNNLAAAGTAAVKWITESGKMAAGAVKDGALKVINVATRFFSACGTHIAEGCRFMTSHVIRGFSLAKHHVASHRMVYAAVGAGLVIGSVLTALFSHCFGKNHNVAAQAPATHTTQAAANVAPDAQLIVEGPATKVATEVAAEGPVVKTMPEATVTASAVVTPEASPAKA